MDEIDRIMAKMLRDVGARAEHHTPEEIVFLIRNALSVAGYCIDTDTAHLLRKGTEVAGGRVT